MLNHLDQPTYLRSMALGRGTEVSDIDFYAFAEGQTAGMDADTFSKLEGLFSHEPWQSELAMYRESFTSSPALEEAAHLSQLAANVIGAEAHRVLNRQSADALGKQTVIRLLEDLQAFLRLALAPSSSALAAASRGAVQDLASEIEAEIAKVEERLGLREKGLSLMALRSKASRLLEHASQQEAEVQRLAELIQRFEQTVLDHIKGTEE